MMTNGHTVIFKKDDDRSAFSVFLPDGRVLTGKRLVPPSQLLMRGRYEPYMAGNEAVDLERWAAWHERRAIKLPGWWGTSTRTH